MVIFKFSTHVSIMDQLVLQNDLGDRDLSYWEVSESCVKNSADSLKQGVFN